MLRSSALLMLFILMTCVGARAQWKNSLAPAGKASEPMTLVENGEANYSILLAEKPTPQDKKAAEGLQHWVAEITGTSLEVTSKQAPGKNYLSLGETTLAMISSQAPTLREEGYLIERLGPNLLLRGGSTRGIINAVYAVLEEDLGCRWYAGDGATLPHTKTLTLNVVPRTFVPKLRVRDPYFKVAFDATWSLRNRTNAQEATVPRNLAGGSITGNILCIRRRR
jgi:hypothetical protein